MESFTDEAGRLVESKGRISRRLMNIAENRFKSLILESEEERILVTRSLVLSLGVFAFGLLGMCALTAGVLIGIRTQHPGLILGVFAGLYGILALSIGLVLRRKMRRAAPPGHPIQQRSAEIPFGRVTPHGPEEQAAAR